MLWPIFVLNKNIKEAVLYDKMSGEDDNFDYKVTASNCLNYSIIN